MPGETETISVPVALFARMKQHLVLTAYEPPTDGDGNYDPDEDTHQLWLDAKDSAQSICDDQGWLYEVAESGDEEEDTDD